MSDVIQICRYSNRKPYSLTDCRYVTLEVLAGHVRAGRALVIKNHSGPGDSGSDITIEILAQVIAQDVKSKSTGYTVAMLKGVLKGTQPRSTEEEQRE